MRYLHILLALALLISCKDSGTDYWAGPWGIALQTNASASEAQQLIAGTWVWVEFDPNTLTRSVVTYPNTSLVRSRLELLSDGTARIWQADTLFESFAYSIEDQTYMNVLTLGGVSHDVLRVNAQYFGYDDRARDGDARLYWRE